MKKIAPIVFALLLSSQMLYAAEVESEGTALRKLQRGFVNIALSPCEIASELGKANQKDTFIPSWFVGIGKGATYMIGRALVGAYEIVTFPFPLPSEYKPILKPEFPWKLL